MPTHFDTIRHSSIIAKSMRRSILEPLQVGVTPTVRSSAANYCAAAFDSYFTDGPVSLGLCGEINCFSCAIDGASSGPAITTVLSKMPKKQANPIDVQVGNRVRIRRMLIGMSQERLGDLLGLTFQQVQKYEKGVNRIGAGRLFEVSRILNVPVNFFYEGLVTALPSDANETEFPRRR